MSGLNVGMMSLDEFELEQIASSGTEAEKKQAKKLIPIVKRHHWLLVSILLGNACAAEALPICLNQMMNESLSITFSVFFVLICGEIIPQAILTGPNQLRIAACMVPLLLTIMILSFPISYPIALALDELLGEDADGHNMDLKQLVVAHEVVSNKSALENRELTNQQYKMIHGALDIHKHSISSCSLPMSEVFALSNSDILDEQLMAEVRAKGFSRIPVYYGDDPSSAYAILLSKRLIGFNTRDRLTLEKAKLDLRMPLFVDPDESLLDLMNKFQSGHVHMAFVCQKPEGHGQHLAPTRLHCIGIITMEDVLEKLLNTDIDDEFDYDIIAARQAGENKNLESVLLRRRFGLASSSWRRLQPPSGHYVKMEDSPRLHY
jgi:CBS domain containing-hemolysin-like protein